MNRHPIVAVVLWLASVAAAVVVARAQVQPADIILSNGKVVTVDDRFSIASALAIRGERIVAVGSDRDVAALAGAGDSAHRSRRPHRHPRAHRQPHASAARRHDVAVRGAARRRGIAEGGARSACAPARRQRRRASGSTRSAAGRWSSSPTTRRRSRAPSSIESRPIIPCSCRRRTTAAISTARGAGTRRRTTPTGVVDEAGHARHRRPDADGHGRTARSEHAADDARPQPHGAHRVRQRGLRSRTCCRSTGDGRREASSTSASSASPAALQPQRRAAIRNDIQSHVVNRRR